MPSVQAWGGTEKKMKTQSTEEAFDFPDLNSSEAAHDKFHNWEPNTLPNTNRVITPNKQNPVQSLCSLSSVL